MKNKFKILLIVLAVIVGVVLYLLNSALIIGSGYAAKYLCSQVFMAERNADVVFDQDVAPTHPLFRFVSHQVNTADVDQDRLQTVMQKAFQEPSETSMRNTHAIVVVYKDRIIAEKYQAPFTKFTPILGWSMTKSVTNALVGILVGDGRLDLFKPAPVKVWQTSGDERGTITLDQMLRMSSGLDFEEVYGPFKDATDMLYNSKSMADFAAAKSLRTGI